MTFNCGFTALDIGCAFDSEKLEYTCDCPAGWLTKDGKQNETLKTADAAPDHIDEFYGCFSSMPSPPLYSVMTVLQKSPSSLESGLAQAVNNLHSISVTSIDPANQKIKLAMTITSSTTIHQSFVELKSYLAHLLNVNVNQISIVRQGKKRDETMLLSVRITGERFFVSASSATKLGFGFLEVLMCSWAISLLSIML